MKDLNKERKRAFYFTALLMLILAIFTYGGGLIISSSDAQSSNVTYVKTKVNVTNTEPNVTFVDITPRPIVLTANGTSTIICNATIFEYNGVDDINLTNATLYDADETTTGGADDNNNHYTNSTCGPSNCAAVGSSAVNFSCECGFSVKYYANNGTNWKCNFTVKDDYNLTSSKENTTTLDGLIALYTPDEIDYGNLSVSQTSEDKELNVTNVGNIDINISVRAYANATGIANENLSMNCDFGYIFDYYQRWAIVGGTPWAQMKNVSNISTMINLTIPQKTEDNVQSNGANATFWKLQIPYTIGGMCNGSLEFIAVDSGTN